MKNNGIKMMLMIGGLLEGKVKSRKQYNCMRLPTNMVEQKGKNAKSGLRNDP